MRRMHQSPSNPPKGWEKNYPGLNWNILTKIENATNGSEKQRLMRLHNEMLNRSYGYLHANPKNGRLKNYRTKRLQTRFFPSQTRGQSLKELGQKRIEALTKEFGTAEREAARQADENAKKTANAEAKKAANKAAAEEAARKAANKAAAEEAARKAANEKAAANAKKAAEKEAANTKKAANAKKAANEKEAANKAAANANKAAKLKANTEEARRIQGARVIAAHNAEVKRQGNANTAAANLEKLVNMWKQPPPLNYKPLFEGYNKRIIQDLEKLFPPPLPPRPKGNSPPLPPLLPVRPKPVIRNINTGPPINFSRFPRVGNFRYKFLKRFKPSGGKSNTGTQTNKNNKGVGGGPPNNKGTQTNKNNKGVGGGPPNNKGTQTNKNNKGVGGGPPNKNNKGVGGGPPNKNKGGGGGGAGPGFTFAPSFAPSLGPVTGGAGGTGTGGSVRNIEFPRIGPFNTRGGQGTGGAIRNINFPRIGPFNVRGGGTAGGGAPSQGEARINEMIRNAGGLANVERGINALEKTRGNVVRAQEMTKLPKETFVNIRRMGGSRKAKRIVQSVRLRRRRRVMKKVVKRRRRSAPASCPICPRVAIDKNKQIRVLLTKLKKKNVVKQLQDILTTTSKKKRRVRA